ncbi:unnamed protein product [Diamesa serratosioi]
MNSTGDSSNKMKSNQNIQVYLRVRPTNARERLIRSNEIVEVSGCRDIIVKQTIDSRTTKKFSFDRAFGKDSQQNEVYAAVVAPLIEEVLAGYNCTVFAYGQTGTGKTYTMVGEEQPELSSSWEDISNVGIIPRALNHLFDELRMMEVEFAMRVSYLELYNEELCDLLSTDDTVKIRIFDDVTKKGSVIVQGLEEIPVRCKDDVYKLLAKGQERRKTAATLMNAQSSRSHTVFSILVHIKETNNDGEEMLKIGKLNLVDLAGSENISKAGNEKGIRTRESVNINQSLLTLGRVITALVERTPHIPYRESKLTRLLQESLGGRTKTSIVATVSPGHKDIEETLSTLDYAHRAKHIQNKPEVNQRLTKKVVLKEYTEEIDRLKRDLMAAREKNGIYLASDTYNDMLYKMETQTKELNEKIFYMKALKDELANKSKLFDDIQCNLTIVSEHLLLTEGKMRITEAELSKTKRNLRKTQRHSEEKSHLLTCHQKTEAALSTHANELIQVVEEASTDTRGLLESIDRRKNVEERAMSENDRLLSNLKNNIIDMKHELTKLTKNHKKNAEIIVEDLNTNTTATKKYTVELLDELNVLKEFRDNSGSDIIKSLNEWKSQTLQESGDNLVSIVQHVKNIQQNQVEFFDKTNLKIYSMEKLLSEEQSVSALKYQELLLKIKEHNEIIETFCEDLKSKIHKYCLELEKLTAKRKKLSTTQKSKLDEIQKLFLEVQSITHECEIIDNSVVKVKEDLENVDNIVIQAFNQKNSTIKSEEIEFVEELEEARMEAHTQLISSINDTKTLANVHNEIQRNLIQKDLVAISKLECQLKENLEGIFVKINTQIQETNETANMTHNTINERLNAESSRSTHQDSTLKCLVQELLHKGVYEVETSVQSKLNRCSKDIAKFQDDDLIKYKSTGETPSRKEYKFNKTIAATSPHDRIIKRLRLEKGLSDTLDNSEMVIREDVENELSADNMNIDSLQIVNSTPLKIQQQVQQNSSDKSGFKDLEISKVSIEEKENQLTMME